MTTEASGSKHEFGMKTAEGSWSGKMEVMEMTNPMLQEGAR